MNTPYLYRMYASNAWGDSGFSNTATGTTLPPPPAPPLAFTATAASAMQVNLMWQLSDDSRQTVYTIERSSPEKSLTHANYARVTQAFHDRFCPKAGWAQQTLFYRSAVGRRDRG